MAEFLQFLTELVERGGGDKVYVAVFYYVNTQQKALIAADLIERIMFDSVLSARVIPVVIASSKSLVAGAIPRGALIEISRDDAVAESVRRMYNFMRTEYPDHVDVPVEQAIEFARATSVGTLLRVFEQRIAVGEKVTRATLEEEKAAALAELGLEVIYPRQGFEVVGGMDTVKRFLRDFVIDPVRRIEEYKRYGARPVKGLLFYGPPGTGKTWIARAMAKEVGIPMVKLSASKIFSKYVGESEANVERITKAIDSFGDVVVFVDEAEQLLLGRDRTLVTDGGVTQRVLSMLLEWMGSHERRSIIILNTNYVENIDFAAIRAGRVDFVVPVPYPDRETRREIVRVHLEQVNPPSVPVTVDYDWVAAATAGYSSAELELIARMAPPGHPSRTHIQSF